MPSMQDLRSKLVDRWKCGGTLASRALNGNKTNQVLTASDVAVEFKGFSG